ncbi:formylglycine-generating enzyme family protein [Aquimarina algiphila]|uniref:formylglycine-generating enzyme family protein n=1 Tax=Aquimarina algiphila TaxID=2047982 RepID=UPI002490F642|nr:SUMF1/EgtB/PvdO family nonheme iron enzyme [Aquimarina algiphila]
MLLTSDVILVKGGQFKNKNSNYFGTDTVVKDFYIGIKEVTQKKWVSIMGYNNSNFLGDNLPVEMVNWYECIEYCNKRSLAEGLDKYYTIDKRTKDLNNNSKYDSLKWQVSLNKKANGYRLPTMIEWEYASSGGQLSKDYTYIGSNNIEDVAWYWCNSGDENLTGTIWNWNAIENNNGRSHRVALKQPNELGLYDMAGNVREWCWDWKNRDEKNIVSGRAWKGGCWFSGEFTCKPSFTEYYTADSKNKDQGFRICRNGS